MSKIIAVASGKGGVGKTTTAINLATAFASFRRSAVVVDANLKTPNVGLYLGSPIVPSSVHDAVSMKKHIKNCVYMHPSGAKIAPGSISLSDSVNANHENLPNIIRQLEGTSEIVVVDSAGGLGDDTFSALDAADEVIVVTTPDIASVTDTLKSIRMIEERGLTVIGAVLNKVSSDGTGLSSKEVEAMLETPVISSIPEDDNMREAVKEKHPVVYSHPDSPSSIAYKELAALLIGQKYEVLTKK
jgi:septum site-determining protein MinD